MPALSLNSLARKDRRSVCLRNTNVFVRR